MDDTKEEEEAPKVWLLDLILSEHMRGIEFTRKMLEETIPEEEEEEEVKGYVFPNKIKSSIDLF